MKPLLFPVLVAMLAATTVAGSAAAQVGIDIQIGVPPPPVVVFRSEPNVVVVPGTSVYYAPDASEYDMYRYGNHWYIDQGGYWYRSKAYRGPFEVIEFGRLPRAIVGVPVEYRRQPQHPHGGPPGHSKSHGKGRGHGKY